MMCPKDLTYKGRDKMDAIFQTTYWKPFSTMKTDVFRLKFHWNLSLINNIPVLVQIMANFEEIHMRFTKGYSIYFHPQYMHTVYSGFISIAFYSRETSFDICALYSDDIQHVCCSTTWPRGKAVIENTSDASRANNLHCHAERWK